MLKIILLFITLAFSVDSFSHKNNKDVDKLDRKIGSFMFMQDGSLVGLIYLELPENPLPNGVQLPYERKPQQEYFIGCFIDGVDYIGQSSFDKICQQYKESGATKTNNTSVDELIKQRPDINRNSIIQWKDFSDNQIKITLELVGLDNTTEQQRKLNEQIEKSAKESSPALFATATTAAAAIAGICAICIHRCRHNKKTNTH